MWESLIDAHGDSLFLDASFNRSIVEEAFIAPQAEVLIDESEKADRDLAIAINLQQQEELLIQQQQILQSADESPSPSRKKKSKCIVM